MRYTAGEVTIEAAFEPAFDEDVAPPASERAARVPAADAPAPTQGPAALRGHVDVVATGMGFVHVQGWVCAADGSPATLPISVRLGDQVFEGYGLNSRHDLAEAGIAGGEAGLNVFLRGAAFDATEEHVVAFDDASGARWTGAIPAARVATFVPSGWIEAVDSHFVTGWVFDPMADETRPTELLVNDRVAAAVEPGIPRFDLPFDAGDGRKLFGFEVPSGVVAAAMERAGTRTATLSLRTSGLTLARLAVHLVGGRLQAAPSFGPSAPHRWPVSDRLDELLGARG